MNARYPREAFANVLSAFIIPGAFGHHKHITVNIYLVYASGIWKQETVSSAITCKKRGVLFKQDHRIGGSSRVASENAPYWYHFFSQR